MAELATRIARCQRCGSDFELALIPFRGRELQLARFCEPCIDAADERDRLRAEAARIERNIAGAGIPADLRGRDYSGFTHAAALAAAQGWARGDLRGLCVHGPVGTGKTRLAAAACWQRLRHRPARWVSVAALMNQLRASFGDEQRAEATRAVTGAGALVLDDVDKANPSEFGVEVVYAAIDGRITAGAPLLVTTNLAPSQLGERLGEAVMSRLAGYCHVVRMEGPDRRLEQRGAR